MTINFIKNNTFEKYIKDVSIALPYSDETLQYLKISLEIYIKNLSDNDQKQFVDALPDFIEIKFNELNNAEKKERISSIRQLADLTLENRNKTISKKVYNIDKLLMNIIVLFTVLQSYMEIDELPILRSDFHEQQQKRDIQLNRN